MPQTGRDPPRRHRRPARRDGLPRARDHRGRPVQTLRPLRQPAADQALRRAPLPAQGQDARRRRHGRRAREHRGRLRRHRRHPQEGHAATRWRSPR